MKLFSETTVEVITKRSIKIEEIEDTNFVVYEETQTATQKNGSSETEVRRGIALKRDIERYGSTYNAYGVFDKIPDKVAVRDMYEGYAFIAYIEHADLEDMYAGRKHISEVVKYIKPETFTIGGCMPILYSPASYKVMTLKYEPLPTPVIFDYTYGGVSNGSYDLVKLLERLKEDEHVCDRENLKIESIPYYNATRRCTETISFKYLLSKEDYANLWKMDTSSLQRYILSEYIKVEDFRIGEDDY